MDVMNQTLLRALILALPAMLLFIWSLILFLRKVAFSLLQLLGSVFLIIVIFAHLSEALHWFPLMDWGSPHSVGHYLDFSGAILGITLVSLGYLLRAFRKEIPSKTR